MAVVNSLSQSALRSIDQKQKERENVRNKLIALQERCSHKELREYFSDAARVPKYAIEVGELYLDYSKNFIDEEIHQTLIDLANAYDLNHAISQLLSGYPVNVTEKRPALHTALRAADSGSLQLHDQDILQEVKQERTKLKAIVDQIHQQKWLGATNKPITDVVNFGIGGSDLGPKMLVEALSPHCQETVNVHFVANVDPCHFDSVVKNLDPQTTLFVVASKSFSTEETLSNANLAKRWLKDKLHIKDVSKHMLAVTANPARAVAFGIAKDNVLSFWPWVGGRFSVWSSIGFSVAVALGFEKFLAFLEGGREMDDHFASAPLAENMPVMMALLGIWYRNFFKAPTLALCPYSYLLRNFPAYIQQLDMESNGKSYSPNGELTQMATAPIIWGGEGTNAQHAFFQLLHQGKHLVPVDFIVANHSSSQHQAEHQKLMLNCFAQAKALMEGDLEKDATQANYQNMPGNKPSNMLLLNSLSPRALGQLIALYEHKVYVQGVIWQINSFDQPGVELGKKLAVSLMDSLKRNNASETLDSSTASLMKRMPKT